MNEINPQIGRQTYEAAKKSDWKPTPRRPRNLAKYTAVMYEHALGTEMREQARIDGHRRKLPRGEKIMDHFTGNGKETEMTPRRRLVVRALQELGGEASTSEILSANVVDGQISKSLIRNDLNGLGHLGLVTRVEVTRKRGVVWRLKNGD